MWATSSKVTPWVGEPRTETRPLVISRSSGAASSMWAATETSLSRTCLAALVGGRPADDARAAAAGATPEGGHGGVAFDDHHVVDVPTPSSSATIWAMVVAMLWPWPLVPRATVTWPPG